MLIEESATMAIPAFEISVRISDMVVILEGGAAF